MKHALILAAALAATSANAEFLTGNDLLTRLNSELNYDQGVAVGYIMGSFDVGYQSNHCPPVGVTLGQVKDMVKQALVATPSVRHLSADSFVSYVLSKNWPCAKRGSSNPNNSL